MRPIVAWLLVSFASGQETPEEELKVFTTERSKCCEDCVGNDFYCLSVCNRCTGSETCKGLGKKAYKNYCTLHCNRTPGFKSFNLVYSTPECVPDCVVEVNSLCDQFNCKDLYPDCKTPTPYKCYSGGGRECCLPRDPLCDTTTKFLNEVVLPPQSLNSVEQDAAVRKGLHNTRGVQSS
eukprot:Trichotokara_eunicae@DN5645_c0_g1_i3.p1